jgi:hypothetical protein
MGDTGSIYDPLKDTYIVICTHPIDGIVDAMEEAGLLPKDATKKLLEEMEPYTENGTVHWDILVDESPVIVDGYAINFIWHGDDALSALAWMNYVLKTVPRKDFASILQWCEEQFE